LSLSALHSDFPHLFFHHRAKALAVEEAVDQLAIVRQIFAIPTQLPFVAEFRLVNTGKLPISIPVSAHLSDLQPADPSVPFTYIDLGLVLRVRGDVGSTASVRLYGAEDHSGTIRVLRPGEWIRIKANLQLDPQPQSCTSLKMQPGFWMHRNQFRATSGYFREDSTGICINEIPMPPPTETVTCARPHGTP
jgi:hypothetical protein